jgi:hypothetical protein
LGERGERLFENVLQMIRGIGRRCWSFIDHILLLPFQTSLIKEHQDEHHNTVNH